MKVKWFFEFIQCIRNRDGIRSIERPLTKFTVLLFLLTAVIKKWEWVLNRLVCKRGCWTWNKMIPNPQGTALTSCNTLLGAIPAVHNLYCGRQTVPFIFAFFVMFTYKHNLWVSMYLVQRYDMRALFLRRLLETGQPFYVVIRGTRKSSLCEANTVPSFVGYFRTLRAGPAPAGIEPTTLRSRFLYSQTLFYGHPLNTDTSLLWTVCFVPGEKNPLHFL